MGVNILTANQADVETDLTGFSFGPSVAPCTLLPSAPGSSSRSTAEHWNGSACVAIVHDGASVNEGVEVAFGGVAAGQSVTISCYVKTTNGQSYALRVQDVTNAGSVVGTTDTGDGVNFRRIVYTYTQGASSSSDVRFCIRSSSSTIGTIYVDGLQVESGASATTWVPGISTLTRTVTTTVATRTTPVRTVTATVATLTTATRTTPTTIAVSRSGTAFRTVPTTISVVLPFLPGASNPSPRVPVYARYAIRVRKPDLSLRDQLSGIRKLSIVKRFNLVSDWALELDADDPVAAQLTNPGWGVQINRTLYDSDTNIMLLSTTEISGPVVDLERVRVGNTLVVHGKDDMLWLAARDAWPVTNLPFSPYVLGLSGLLRYYRLGETSGTVATDSKSAVNGTYTGGFTLSQPSLIDDDVFGTKLNGTTGFITAATTSLPTVNAAWALGVVVSITAYGGAFSVPLSYGTWGTTKAAPYIGIDTTGHAYAGTFSADTAVSATAIPLNTPTLIIAQYDGTNLRCYVAGVQTATSVPGTLAVALAGMRIGASASGTASNFFNGEVQEAFIFNRALTTQEITNIASLAATRFYNAAYDTRTGAGETVLRGYVDANAGLSAIPSRRVPGLTVMTDLAQGTNVTGNARFDKLVRKDGTGLLQILAIAAGVGFYVSQNGSSLEFHVYAPQDKSALVRFSESLGSVLDFRYTRAAPDPDSGGNVYVVGGSGDLTARVFSIRTNPTSIGNWGRIEGFQDARDTADLPTMQQRGDAALLANAEVTTFSAQLSSGPSAVYGLDFNLGDKITVVSDSLSWVDTVREVDITLASGQPETITPYVGTPNATLVDSDMARLRRSNAQLAARIQQLERRK